MMTKQPLRRHITIIVDDRDLSRLKELMDGGRDFPREPNKEIRTPRDMRQDLRDMRRLRWLYRVGRRGLRGHPILTYLDILTEVVTRLKNYQTGGEPGWENLGPWVQMGYCSQGYTGPMCRVTQTTAYNSSWMKNFCNNCVSGQAFDIGTLGDPWGGIPDSVRGIIIGSAYEVPGSWRARCTEYYTRPEAGAFEEPTWSDGAVARQFLSQVSVSRIAMRAMSRDPHLIPVAAPGLAFIPTPNYNELPHWQHPNREARNQASARAPEPLGRFENDYSIAFSTDRVHSQPPHYHYKRPPERNVQERKIKVSAAMAASIRFVNSATEGLDLLDAFYESLPDRFKPRYRDTKYVRRVVKPQDKLRAVADHWREISLPQLLYNIGANQIEDMIYGKIGRAGGDVSKRLGHAYGTGINHLTGRIGKVYYQYRKHERAEET
jgi:hypothetical protein